MKEADIVQELITVIKASISELEVDINKTTDISSLDI